jgi:hypothetical protein
MVDIRIAMLTVMANSRNRRPISPPIRRTGMNTAISETLIETMVKPISFEPLSAAWSGVSPCSRYRVTFSTMTMASSTTNPVAIVSAIRLLRL